MAATLELPEDLVQLLEKAARVRGQERNAFAVALLRRAATEEGTEVDPEAVAALQESFEEDRTNAPGLTLEEVRQELLGRWAKR
jgi:uncharacterized protein (DUF1778 family)